MEMTLADKMFEGLAMSVMGFIIVFTVLLVIMGILSVFNLVAKCGGQKTQEPAAPPVQPDVQEQYLIDDKQLVAVIPAAVMAMQAENGGRSDGTDGLVVKSIRRVNAWNTEALQNNGY